MKVDDSAQDVAGEYIKRYLILGSRIPFIKVPLFFVGAIALAGKGVEKLIEARKEKEQIATVVGEDTDIWTSE
jgi:predicted DNA repair protein MutK